jgi:hypothetical protein
MQEAKEHPHTMRFYNVLRPYELQVCNFRIELLEIFDCNLFTLENPGVNLADGE